jgi:transposase InsO family protein
VSDYDPDNPRHQLILARQYIADNPLCTKSLLCRVLGIKLSRRAGIYYQSRLEDKDQILAEEIKLSLVKHPCYGAKRLADNFKIFGNSAKDTTPINHKRISRVMVKFDISCTYRKKKKVPRDRNLPNITTPNLLKALQLESKIKSNPLFETNIRGEIVPSQIITDYIIKTEDKTQNGQIVNPTQIINTIGIYKPNQVWSKDFTYLNFHGVWYYLSTIKDDYTKEIVGYSISDHHNESLVTTTMTEAIAKYGIPYMTHSDQGSEFRAINYQNKLQSLGILISMSDKGHPWENGSQESHYSYFKLELGSINRFNTLGELMEAIYQQI